MGEITDHHYSGYSGAIRFSPAQSHNPMAQPFSLSTHLGNSSLPFHFISSNQSHIVNENAQTRKPDKILLASHRELLH